MLFDNSITTGAILWISAIVALVFLQRVRQMPSTGLPLLYLAGLTIIHLPGALVHNVPWYSYRNLIIVEPGFEQSVYATLAFAVGCGLILLFIPITKIESQVLLKPNHQRSLSLADQDKQQHLPSFWHDLAIFCFITGQLTFFILNPLFRSVPTLSALISIMQQTSYLGVGIGLFYAFQLRDHRLIILWFIFALIFPLQTIVFQGFIGFGINSLLAIILFVFPHLRFRLVFIPLLCLVVYLGVSVYVTYFRDRTEIRASVWGGQILSDRFAVLGKTITDFEFFDGANQIHLRMIDERLNQNQLLGLAIFNLSNRYVPYAKGETFWQAGAALIPRVLWPDKPVVAGGNQLASFYTGQAFAAGTSVGVGQVMEFYLNFSTTGIVIGFVLLGALIFFIDWQAGLALREGRWDSLIHWYLPGLSMIQPGGAMTEVVASFGAALIVSQIFTRFARRILAPNTRTDPSLPPRPVSRPRP